MFVKLTPHGRTPSWFNVDRIVSLTSVEDLEHRPDDISSEYNTLIEFQAVSPTVWVKERVKHILEKTNGKGSR